MKRGVYAVRDRLTHFLTLSVQDNDPVAMRMFENWLLTETKENPRMANDFSLFKIGTYDDEDGKLCPTDNPYPELLMYGQEVLEKYEIQD